MRSNSPAKDMDNGAVSFGAVAIAVVVAVVKSDWFIMIATVEVDSYQLEAQVIDERDGTELLLGA